MDSPKRHSVNFVTVLGLLAAAVSSFLYLKKEKKITIDRTIETSMEPRALWQRLNQAFENSARSDIWPNELELIESDGIDEANILYITYKSPFSENMFSYTITEYDRANLSFAFVTNEDHPLEGEGRVSVTAIPEGTRLTWYGTYSFRGISLTAIYLKFYFEKRFFEALENNIRDLEAIETD